MSKQSLSGVFFKGIVSSWMGMRLTIKHLMMAFRRRKVQDIQHPEYFGQKNGLATITYPYETIPVPEHGRYQLHNEIEDCIVCDKCAKICPVDCIDIEPIRSPGEFGKTSDGTSRRIYAAKFDIDMAKCCFCGLCTTVCPTECLTMTPEYDFSTFDLTTMNFGFGNISPAEAQQKQVEWELFQAEKAKKKAPEIAATPPDGGNASPGFRPRMAPRQNTTPTPTLSEPDDQKSSEVHPPPSAKPGMVSVGMDSTPQEVEKEIPASGNDMADTSKEIKPQPSRVGPTRNRPIMPSAKPKTDNDTE